ncbi:MAG: 2-hydroxyacid dehydrogenase [Candidatus Hodarchaeales archaeon]
MEVVFAHRVSMDLQEIYLSRLPPVIKSKFLGDLSEGNIIENVRNAEVLVTYKVSKGILENAEKLKHIQVPWTGVETLDFQLLKKYPHITVSNSHSNSLAIAEHAVALILSTAKRIALSDRMMRKGDWTSRYDSSMGVWINNKTLGVIGLGAIGRKVAKIMKNGFGCKVYAIKKKITNNTTENEQCDFIGTSNDLHKVLSESDFILISLPLTRETEGFIGKKELDKMKKSAVLVNISRGPVIDEKALYTHLKERKILGAGIDTWYNYPKDRDKPTNVYQNYPFESLDNIVMTPHSAFKISNREEAFAEDIIKNILQIYQDKEPINKIDLELGY